MKFRTLIRVIADNDFELELAHGKVSVARPVAVLPSWNWRKPVMLTSWPPAFSSLEDMQKTDDWKASGCWRGYAMVDRDDLNAEDTKWVFDVEWCE